MEGPDCGPDRDVKGHLLALAIGHATDWHNEGRAALGQPRRWEGQALLQGRFLGASSLCNPRLVWLEDLVCEVQGTVELGAWAGLEGGGLGSGVTHALQPAEAHCQRSEHHDQHGTHHKARSPELPCLAVEADGGNRLELSHVPHSMVQERLRPLMAWLQACGCPASAGAGARGRRGRGDMAAGTADTSPSNSHCGNRAGLEE
mmetsp:Transcript_61399/g.182965  ORF Transcript_61399/g.182965 Transcript_61399/m.182965 type:complete len:203 (+) Transcript_61399:636-1244(+)